MPWQSVVRRHEAQKGNVSAKLRIAMCWLYIVVFCPTTFRIGKVAQCHVGWSQGTVMVRCCCDSSVRFRFGYVFRSSALLCVPQSCRVLVMARPSRVLYRNGKVLYFGVRHCIGGVGRGTTLLGNVLAGLSPVLQRIGTVRYRWALCCGGEVMFGSARYSSGILKSRIVVCAL